MQKYFYIKEFLLFIKIAVLYYIYEGTKLVERNRLLRVLIDIKISKSSSFDVKLAGEVSSVEELLMFLGDYRWAKGFSYFLREAEEVYLNIRTKIIQILYAKTDRRINESVVPPKALGKRRPRTYRNYLPQKYKPNS